MNILLWVLQSVLAMLSISGGAFQIFKINELEKGVAAMRELPHGLWAVLGAIGIIAGVGLILPAALKLMPVLTPVSAAVMAVHSLVIIAFYLKFGDRAPLPYVIVMALLAAFIAFGRFVLRPI